MGVNVLINCEESGVVREEFHRLGYNAWSCDLLPSRKVGNHLQMDALDALKVMKWDMMIFFAPCTFLANSGARWLYNKDKTKNEARWLEMEKAAKFFNALLDADIPLIAGENPIQHKHARNLIRKQDQIIQPWMFGHGETKATCLWLKGLPKLQPTNIVSGREQRIWKMPPSETRQRDRSTTFLGIGKAMAKQWGYFLSLT